MAAVDNKSFLRGVPAFVLLLAAAAIFGASAYIVLLHGNTWPEEIAYLVRSDWYVSHDVAPYTATDATGAMPLYFYQLGYWQQFVGRGVWWGRLLSAGIGVVNGLLLFAICKRLTANSLAAAAAVLVFLATPATAFYFATATPTSTVSALHLAAIWLIVTGLGRPRMWATVLLGLLLSALFLFRQHMILAVVALAPLYIAAIGRKRSIHGVILLAVMAAASAAIFYAFPDKLAHYAMRLPVVYKLLGDLRVLPPNFTLIDRGATGSATLELTLHRASVRGLYDGLLLPYLGTILLALSLFAVVSGPLRILWVAALYFLWLVVGHYVGSLSVCGGGCMISYMPYFIAVGALAGAITLAMAARWARGNGWSPAIVVGGAAIIAVAINASAPGLAFGDGKKFFPLPQVNLAAKSTEQGDIDTLARWVASNTPPREPILIIQGLGKAGIPALPYAAALAGHAVPAQSLDLAGTKRTINPKILGPGREAVQGAVEDESLWTDATLARWIDRDYELILLQDDKTIDQSTLLGVITERFDQAASTSFRGDGILLFKRKAAQ